VKLAARPDQRTQRRLLYALICIYTMAHMDAFQTLADPTRRQIVETLRAGELQVGDIVERLAIHQSGVSRHLHILLDAGFVQVRPDGQHRLYSLRQEPFRELEAWLASYREVWEARLDRFGAALELRRKNRARNPKRP
jgi:DNA-binding transcriptional ArsR family regulator